MTLRAVEILRTVDLIAVEDTRKTRILLDHFEIRKPMISYHDYNERERTQELLARIQQGRSIALVSDAGTPCISDPGYRLVAAAIERRISVVPIPGPAAFLVALILTGVLIESFVFEGFLPAKKGRATMLANLAIENRPIVLYESPHRLLRTLRDIREKFGNRNVVLARELTKRFEEVLRGDLQSILVRLSARAIRGEFVIIIYPAS